ncbi:MAG: regulatory protein RecX [Spirochaetota bacterium]
MRITRIEQKKGALVAHADGAAIAVPDDIALEFGITVGRELSDDELTAVVHRSKEVFAGRYAMNLLARAARSEYQVRTRLARKGYESDIIDDAIVHLTEIGFLDDTHYAKLLVDHYREKMRSAREIRFRLANAHIDSDIIDEVMLAGAAAAERAALNALLDKHYRAYAAGEKGLRTLMIFLRRKGFSHDAVTHAIRERREGASE